jgi:ankyrin repeat protein
MLHKAVFEGNLPLVSRLLNCQSDRFIFAERNQLDESGNTPLMLAVKLQNLDAVKVLTDSFSSAKLNATPQTPSPFELACAMKNRSILEVLMNSVQKLKMHYLELNKEAI